MNLFGEKGIMSLTSFILAACIAQARRFSSGCGLLDHSSVVAIGLKLTTCEPWSLVKFHSTWHMNLFGEKGIMSLTSFILAACIALARRLSSGCGLLDQPSVLAIGLKLATCEP